MTNSTKRKVVFKHDFAFWHRLFYKIKVFPHWLGFHTLEEDSSIHSPPFLKCSECGITFNSYGVCVSK